MNDRSEVENQILDTHHLFWDALAKRDLDRRFSVCADDVTFFGTGLHERAINKIEYQRINQKGVDQFSDPFEIKFLWENLVVLNDVAWVESELEWIQEIDHTVAKDLLRTTTILKYENKKWWIVHVHGSTPDYRFQEGDYMTNATTIKRNSELERQVYERTSELNNALEGLKATQTQLIQSEKMASLGELTAGIAHEIQNPLNFVNNFSEVSKELIGEMNDELAIGNWQLAKEISKDIEQNLEKINHHGKRADAIVKGMLQHSRSSSRVKEPTDINALCDEYLRLSYHGLKAIDKSFNATMKTDFDESIGKINVIAQDMGRVILNLLSNAFYAVNEKKKQQPEGYEPTVTISTEVANHPLEGQRGVKISIKDNGNGIPQKVLDKIFQPFFTTKPSGKGTGLGLSLSYDIITNGHGGTLKVATREGEATSFTIQIPALPA